MKEKLQNFINALILDIQKEEVELKDAAAKQEYLLASIYNIQIKAKKELLERLQKSMVEEEK